MNWFGFELSSFLWIFIVLNIVNVIIQTIKSITTINSGKTVAALTNAIAYGIYTVVVVYMNADGLGLFWKALIIGLANLIGVYVVKYFEEKSRKEKLWKVEATITAENFVLYKDLLDNIKIPHNYIDIDKYVILNFYCATSRHSEIVKGLLVDMKAKYFVSDSKIL